MENNMLNMNIHYFSFLFILCLLWCYIEMVIIDFIKEYKDKKDE